MLLTGRGCEFAVFNDGAVMFVHKKKVIAVHAYKPHKTGKGVARIDFGGAVILPPGVTSYKSHKITSSSGIWPLVLLLAACGGGGGGGGSGTKPVVTAIPPVKKPTQPAAQETRIDGELYDPPIEDAQVYIDVNRNQQVDGDDILVDDSTDNQGRFEGTMPAAHRDKPLIADNRNAKHVGSSNPLPDYFMAPAGSDVISPLTHVIFIGAANLDVFQNSILFRDYKPLTDNIYDPNRASVYAFGDSIKRFLEELTNLIITQSDLQILESEILELVSSYDNHLQSVVEKSPMFLTKLTSFDLDVERDNLAEHTNTTERIKLADLRVKHQSNIDVLGQLDFILSGDDKALFEIEDGVLYLKVGVELDHETASQHSVTVTVKGTDRKQKFTLDVRDINDTAPVIAGGESKTINVSEDVALGSAKNKGAIIYKASTTPDVTGDTVTYSLKEATGGVDFFGIDADSGEVWFIRVPDVDGGKTSYSFTLVATVGEQSAEQVVTVTVEDATDERLTLGRDASLVVDADDGLTHVGDGEARVKENSSADMVLYKVTKPVPDVAGHHIYFYLSGDDATRFTIDGDGNLRLRAPPDHETPHDDNEDNIYDVTIHAREVVDAPSVHNLGDGKHPTKAGNVDDASHAVTVTVEDVNDEAPVIAGGESKTINVSEAAQSFDNSRTWDNPVNNLDAYIVYRAKASKDDAGPKIEWSLSGADAQTFGINSDGVIWLRQPLNYESDKKSYSFTISAKSGVLTGQQKITVNVQDADETPSEMKVKVIESELSEKHDVSRGIKVAEIEFTDDALGTNHVTIVKSDIFEIQNGVELWVKAGAVLRPKNHSIEISADVSGIGSKPSSITFSLQVVSDPGPPVMAVTAPAQPFTLTETDQSDSADTGWRVTATDPDNNLQGYELKSWDAVNERYVDETRFEFKDGKLLVKAGQKFDYETTASLTLRIFAIDQTGLKSTPAPVIIALEDINDDPVKITAPVFSHTDQVRGFPVDENVTAHNDASERDEAYIVMRAAATKDDVGPDIEWSLEGADKDAFGINSAGEVWFRKSPNYESSTEGVPAKQSYEFTIVATSGLLSDKRHVRVKVNDVDEAPSEMQVTTVLASLPERSTLPSDGLKLAKISFKDDALGDNGLVQKLAGVFSYKIIDKVYWLWLNGNADMSAPGTYTALITPEVTGSGTRPLPQIFTFTITNVPEAPQMTVTEDPGYPLMETASSAAQPTGFRVSAIDPDPNETVTFSVHGDTRFEVHDGRLWVKAGQKFDYESERPVTLIIRATDNSAAKLTDEKQITVQIGNDLTEKPVSDVTIPVETLPTFDGRKLAQLTITTKLPESNYNIGLERIGNWNVQNQDGGNVLTLKIRFDDGNEIVVARLVRDDAQSAYRLERSEGTPALNTKVAGKYGYFQITDVISVDASVGDSTARIIWKYVVLGASASGAPADRLRPGESATEQIDFIVQSSTNEASSSGDKIKFKIIGKNDRPFFLESDSEATTLADEFPVTVSVDGTFPNWKWWQEGNIIQFANRPLQKNITVDRSDGLVWRFVPVDVDGDYFETPEDGAPRDYGDIAGFVEDYIRFGTDSSRKWSLTHQYFEVVQAKDDDGNPRFITMPDEENNENPDRLPVLELRLRSDVIDSEIPAQSFTLILKGGGEDFEENEVSIRFEVPLIAARELDPVVISGGDSVTLPIDENIAANPDRSERGDAFLVYNASATKDRTAPDIEWSLDGDDKDAFGINSDGEVWFLASPNYEDKSSYSVKIIAKAGGQSAEQTVTVTVNDVPEAPELSIETPDPPPVIYSGNTTQRIDTGYRLSATDEDGDEVYFRVENSEFAIRNGNELWIKKNQSFNHKTNSQITVIVKAIDKSTSKRKDTDTITFNVVDPAGVLQITSPASKGVRENVASNNDTSSRGDAAIIYQATAQLSTSNKAVEWRLEGSDANSFGIDDNGNIWFRASPDYESAKKSYSFDLVAEAANGQLTTRQTVTINIENVIDTRLVLKRDAKFMANADDGLMHIGDGVARIKEKSSADMVLYKVTKPKADVAGNKIYFYLSGDDAARFTIDGDGNLRLRAEADHETPRDKDNNNLYHVTIHAREVKDALSGHNLSEHPEQASTKVPDASHVVRVRVRNQLDEALTVNEITGLRVNENSVEPKGNTRLSVTMYEAGEYEIEYRMVSDVKPHDYVTVSPDGVISLHRAPNYETTPSRPNISFSVEARYKKAGQADDAGWSEARKISITVIDVPEAPELSIETPDPPPVIYSGNTTQRIDTGYRLSATDEDGDEVYFRVENSEFAIRNGNELWIKKNQSFNHKTNSQITVIVKAIDKSTSKRKDTDTITFNVVDPAGVLQITSPASKGVRENVASNNDTSSRGDAAIIYQATAQLSTSNKAVEWRLEGSDANSFGIDDNGNIWFRASPDYESAKKSYSFDLVAEAANGQLTTRQTVTINIENVDETPSEMRLGKTFIKLAVNTDIKLVKKLVTIKFKDDALGENNVAIKHSELFKIKQGDKANTLELWLKPGAELRLGEYEVIIEPRVTGAGDPPDAVRFTLIVVPSSTPRIELDERSDMDVRAPSRLSIFETSTEPTVLSEATAGDLTAVGSLRISNPNGADDNLRLSVRPISVEGDEKTIDSNGENKTFIGKFGRFGMEANGIWFYELDVNDVDTLKLAHNETSKDVFRVKVTDVITGFTNSIDLEINVTGGHEAPSRTGGEAEQVQTKSVQYDHPIHSKLNGQLKSEMFGIDPNNEMITHVKITSMIVNNSPSKFFFNIPMEEEDNQRHVEPNSISQTDPLLIPVSDLMEQPPKRWFDTVKAEFHYKVSREDIVDSDFNFRIKYKLIDRYGLESPEYETIFKPASLSSGMSASKGRVGQYGDGEIAGLQDMLPAPDDDMSSTPLDFI